MEDGECIATEAPKAPVTKERKIGTDLEKYIAKPYVARALQAADVGNPDGTKGHPDNGMTVLQQHVAFFDQNNDGVVYPWETFKGIRDLGFDPFSSFVITFVINAAFSYRTLRGWVPNPLLPIYIERIHRDKHGSDSATYDTEGRFMPVNLENMFTKYALTKPDNLSLKELWQMTEGNRAAFDYIGWLASKLEWLLLYYVAKDKQGFLSKEAVRGCFDGSLFKNISKMYKDSDRKSK
ncbi:putative peroxygenase 3 [Gossypium australe]|uniref:Putative peroxygenase 3 n=1 Tax=Gossypium australe TaxID=47621 RepID=A0A5B6WGA0_9ROSI|nr:putative peroxygenase 3 [Gossypium australe]